MGSEIADEDATTENAPMRKMTVEFLKKYFEPHSVMSTLSCAGNRRDEFKDISKNVQGHGYGIGAIGNLVFTGVRLPDLLQELGFKPEDLKGKHLIAEGIDNDVVGNCFQVSIPLERAIDPSFEVIIAYSVNGEELPLDHGYPLRLIAPGIVGVRNAKWIKSLIISDIPSQSVYQ